MSEGLLSVRSVDSGVVEEQLHHDHEEFAVPESWETAAMFGRAVIDRYRCPATFVDFSLTGKLSASQGYFRFGSAATCYGRSCTGARQDRAERSLYDTHRDVVVENGHVKLPFDPSEVVDNLRLERYVDARAVRNSSQSWLRKLYYLLRPFTNRFVRKQIQKFNNRNWRERSFPRWPVDTTVENICEQLLLLSMEAKGVDRIPFVWFWPEGTRGCVVMTHDVETAAGRDFCMELMDFDDSFGIKASFQIVPEGRYAVSEEFLKTIRDRQFDFGIQDWNHDGLLFDSAEEFERRAAMINRYASKYDAHGFRAAVLYRRPEWFDKLNLSFDMSIPNVAHLDPQRGGCCTVMPYFIGNMLEIPVTTVQDYTLVHLLGERSIDLWKAQIDMILEKSGMASFIVHPDYLIDPGTRSVYGELLRHLRNRRDANQLWFGLPAEVDSWWRARSKMSLEPTGDWWRVVGEGAERAVLAYATNVDGKLVYEIPSANDRRH